MQRQAEDDGAKPQDTSSITSLFKSFDIGSSSSEVQQLQPAKICNTCIFLEEIKMLNEKLLDVYLRTMNETTNFEMNEEKLFFFMKRAIATGKFRCSDANLEWCDDAIDVINRINYCSSLISFILSFKPNNQ
ncbi:GSCOCG00001424001-RA-CDS [Cotesia congregata]|uniref:Uncharacterized protein n=1 Tax=Cotesia congregata TaxID=51543 RepID=A0A8J2EC53_COTCN|nr:GSCOCG00001424001-RA-CDS [Cotesia congregata]CAG5076715.1 Protein of unknown function [Cotesia congregata]